MLTIRTNFTLRLHRVRLKKNSSKCHKNRPPPASTTCILIPSCNCISLSLWRFQYFSTNIRIASYFLFLQCKLIPSAMAEIMKRVIGHPNVMDSLIDSKHSLVMTITPAFLTLEASWATVGWFCGTLVQSVGRRTWDKTALQSGAKRDTWPPYAGQFEQYNEGDEKKIWY